jgi:hypothetical protein
MQAVPASLFDMASYISRDPQGFTRERNAARHSLTRCGKLGEVCSSHLKL